VLILGGPTTSTAGMSSLEPVASADVETVVVGVHSRVEGFDLESGTNWYFDHTVLALYETLKIIRL